MFLFIFRTLATCDAIAITAPPTPIQHCSWFAIYSLVIIVMWCYRIRIFFVVVLVHFATRYFLRSIELKKRVFFLSLSPVQAMTELVYGEKKYLVHHVIKMEALPMLFLWPNFFSLFYLFFSIFVLVLFVLTLHNIITDAGRKL